MKTSSCCVAFRSTFEQIREKNVPKIPTVDDKRILIGHGGP